MYTQRENLATGLLLILLLRWCYCKVLFPVIIFFHVSVWVWPALPREQNFQMITLLQIPFTPLLIPPVFWRKTKQITFTFSLGTHCSSSSYTESGSFCLLRNCRFLWSLWPNLNLIYLSNHLFLLPLLSMSILMFSGAGESYFVYCERLLQ